jgi:Resolvase, N terminal domain
MRRRLGNQLVLDLDGGGKGLSPEAAPEELLQALADLLLEALSRQNNTILAEREGVMHPKLTPDHLGRGAVVYVRQSTMGQVAEHTESQRRQYALAESARSLGFASVTVIDDDLGRSGSGLVVRPGFQKLVASVCSRLTGAVFCIEASRLARNGRDWHHLSDLCALVGTLVIDPMALTIRGWSLIASSWGCR